MGSEEPFAVPRGLSETPVPVCLFLYSFPNSSAKVCERPLGSVFLTPVSSSTRSGPGIEGPPHKCVRKGPYSVCFNPLVVVGRDQALKIPGVDTLSTEREGRKDPVARVNV